MGKRVFPHYNVSAPKGQQNIAQCNALGKRIPPPPKLQRPKMAAEYPKGNALMSKTIKC